MGSQDSKNADILLKNQNIEDWFKTEDQGHCQLWTNRRTGRHFKAYTIPQTAINDQQQLQKYAFRKTHHNYLVTVEGVLGQGQGLFCSQPRSSFVLVENITSRLSLHRRNLTFEQALYVLFVSASGYHMLTSFFGPLQPHEDMICINDEGHVKIWLNENLALNEPSPIARGDDRANTNRQAQGEEYNVFMKRRIRQCVHTLFWIVERTIPQGYPINFREQIQNISTYFEAASFVQHYREKYSVKMEDKIPITSKNILFTKPMERTQISMQPQVVHPNQVQRMGNLEISRVNNVIYRSSHVIDNTKGLERSRSDYIHDYRTAQGLIMPKITFQIRPSAQFHNVPKIGLTPMNSPVPLIQTNNQTYNFAPSPNIAPNHYVNNIQSVPPKVLKATTVEAETTKNPLQQHIILDQLTKIQSQDGRVKVNFEEDNVEEEEISYNKKEETNYHAYSNPAKLDSTLVTKLNQIQNETSLQSKQANQQQENVQSHRDNIHQTQFTFCNIHQTQFTFKNQDHRGQLTGTQAQNFQPQHPQQYGEINNSQHRSLLHGSQQYESFEQSEDKSRHNYQDAYEIPPNISQFPATNHQEHYVPQLYNGYRSPILQQDQTSSPVPNEDKAEEIQEWQAQLNKFTQSSKKPVKPVSYLASPIPESENESSRDPGSNRKIADNIQSTKQEYVNKMVDLGKDDIEKYIRMKYQDYIKEPGANSQKSIKSYEQPYKYQPKSQEVNKYQYGLHFQSNYSSQPSLKSWQKREELPAYGKEEYQEYNYQANNVGKENYQPNKFTINSYDINYQPAAYKPNFDSEIPFKSEYAPYSQEVYNEQPNDDPYASWKQADRNKKKPTATSNIDEKYNKYVLNSQKVKPAASSRGINSWDISQILPTEESKVTRQQLKPILQTFERAQKRVKTAAFGQGEPSQLPSKQSITYDKLRTLLWEE